MVTMSAATSGESQIVITTSPGGESGTVTETLTHMVCDDDMPSSPDSTAFDDDDDDDDCGSDILANAMDDDVTAQLAAAGTILF
jgi:hypothetical protein